MSAPVAFLVKLSWPAGPEHVDDTPEQVAGIKHAIECICGVESVEEYSESPDLWGGLWEVAHGECE